MLTLGAANLWMIRIRSVRPRPGGLLSRGHPVPLYVALTAQRSTQTCSPVAWSVTTNTQVLSAPGGVIVRPKMSRQMTLCSLTGCLAVLFVDFPQDEPAWVIALGIDPKRLREPLANPDLLVFGQVEHVFLMSELPRLGADRRSLGVLTLGACPCRAWVCGVCRRWTCGAPASSGPARGSRWNASPPPVSGGCCLWAMGFPSISGHGLLGFLLVREFVGGEHDPVRRSRVDDQFVVVFVGTFFESWIDTDVEPVHVAADAASCDVDVFAVAVAVVVSGKVVDDLVPTGPSVVCVGSELLIKCFSELPRSRALTITGSERQAAETVEQRRVPKRMTAGLIAIRTGHFRAP